MKDDNAGAYEGLRLDDDDELNALTLSTLLNSGVEEALSSLTPEQLMRLAQNVEKLKKQKTPATGSGKGRRSEMASPRKRRAPAHSDDDLHGEGADDSGSSSAHRSRSSGGQYMNLPASAPQVESRDGSDYLIFTYSTKGHVQEYCICIDIDSLHIDDIPEDFKSENCVYPRALVPREAYVGNRYEYETIVNDIAWKLTWLNASILSGKRGLIQRAVDSYRNRVTESRSRRVLRQEKLSHGTLRRRAESYDGEPRQPKTLSFSYAADKNSEAVKVKIRIDVENVDTALLEEAFKASNCIYPQAYEEKDAYPDSRWEYENACNELGWKLAYLNAPKLSDNRSLLQRAVDAYNQRFDHNGAHHHHNHHHPLSINHPKSSASPLHYGDDGSGDFSNMVARTLQQALAEEAGHHDVEDDPYGHHAAYRHMILGDPSIGSPHEDDEDDDGHSTHRESGAEGATARGARMRRGLRTRGGATASDVDDHMGEEEEEDEDDHPQTVSTADLLLNH